MGQLTTWHYRTTLFAKLADHTYVTCGDRGKAWSCWGGKQGGTILRQGTGSTQQADAIAESDERARITCYLINGVCHQAANRILFPAGITVRGARGYAVSEAMFGTYGRPRALFGMCKAPFDKHSSITGDIPECAQGTSALSTLEKRIMDAEGDDQDEAYQAYLGRVSEIYESAASDIRTLGSNGDINFQLSQFELMTDFKLSDTTSKGHLMDIRATTEHQRLGLEQLFENNELSIAEFVEQSNALDESFQENIANTLSKIEYEALLELEPGDFVVLGDPEIANRHYAGEAPSE